MAFLLPNQYLAPSREFGLFIWIAYFLQKFFVPAPFVNGTSRHVLWAIIAITWPFLGPKLKPHQVFFFLRDTNKNIFKGAFSTKRIT